MARIKVAETTDISSGEALKVTLDGAAVALVRVEERFYAVGDVCSHANYSLSEGEVYAEDLEIECWKHGSTFSLIDGKPQCLPATGSVPVYEVEVEDGMIYLVSKEGGRSHGE